MLKIIIKIIKWFISLPFKILWFVSMIAYALTPVAQKIAIIFGIFYVILCGNLKWWIDKKDYRSMAETAFFILIPFIAQAVFSVIMTISQKIEFKILYGTPLFKSNDETGYRDSPRAAADDQKITLTMSQLRELLNKDR